MESSGLFPRIPPRHPDDLILVANAFLASRALMVAQRLGIFPAIGHGALSSLQIADKIDCQPQAISILLRALAGMGLIRASGGRFELSEVSRRSLLPDGDRYLGDYINMIAHLWDAWTDLEDVVRGGRPAEASREFRQDPGIKRDFVMGLHQTALGNAPLLAEGVDLEGRHHLLDLGGGPGTYAYRFLARYPGLKATILDGPATIGIAREIVKEAGFEDRVEFREGNFMKDPLGGPYDVVLMSHVVHLLTEPENQELLNRIAESLEPGGVLVIHDFFLNREGSRPRFAAIFGLHRLVMGKGRTYPFHEVRKWLGKAGFVGIRWHDVGEPRGISVVSAVREGREHPYSELEEEADDD